MANTVQKPKRTTANYSEVHPGEPPSKHSSFFLLSYIKIRIKYIYKMLLLNPPQHDHQLLFVSSRVTYFMKKYVVSVYLHNKSHQMNSQQTLAMALVFYSERTGT